MKSALILILVVAFTSVEMRNAAVEDTFTETSKTQTKGISKQGDVKLRSNLLRSLMENYESGINPDAANVKFGLSLLTIDINEAESTLESNVWLRFSWHDSRLAWDTTVFPVDMLRVEAANVWRPDVRLYNAADTFSTTTSCSETNVVLYANGNVIWVPPCHLSSMCKTTLKLHPYEPQACPLKFGSWTYDSVIMDIDFFANETTIDISELQDLSEWKVLSTHGVKNTKVYPCCPEPYADLTFNVTLQRKPDADRCFN